MNAAWHARRAKREIRAGRDLKDMPHMCKLRLGYACSLLSSRGVVLQVTLRHDSEA